MKIIENILHALHNKPEGFSMRKITTAVTVLCMIYAHLRYLTPDNVVEMTIIDASFVSLLLGIVSAEQIIMFKNGKES